MPACSDCGVERAREAFSAAQLKKKKTHQGRRCQLCVAQRELTPPLPSGADEVAHALSAASEAEREEARLLARLEAVRASKEAAHARAAAAKLSSDGTSVDHAPAPPPPPGSSSVDALVVQTPESHQPTGKRLTLQTFVGSPKGAARGGGGSPVDADSLAALPTLADSDSPKEAPLLLRMTVEIGNGRTGEVKVKRGDAPDALAATFCATHGLGERAKARLTDHIATNLADVLRQRASAAANAAPPRATTKPPPATSGAPPSPPPCQEWQLSTLVARANSEASSDADGAAAADIAADTAAASRANSEASSDADGAAAADTAAADTAADDGVACCAEALQETAALVSRTETEASYALANELECARVDVARLAALPGTLEAMHARHQAELEQLNANLLRSLEL